MKNGKENWTCVVQIFESRLNRVEPTIRFYPKDMADGVSKLMTALDDYAGAALICTDRDLSDINRTNSVIVAVNGEVPKAWIDGFTGQ